MFTNINLKSKFKQQTKKNQKIINAFQMVQQHSNHHVDRGFIVFRKYASVFIYSGRNTSLKA